MVTTYLVNTFVKHVLVFIRVCHHVILRDLKCCVS